MKNIVVLYGGKSTEHDISIISAMQVINNLDAYLYNILPVYIDKNGQWYLTKKIHSTTELKHFKLKKVTILTSSDYLYKINLFGLIKLCHIDCVVVCMHGKNGEDGSVSGLLNLSNIPYTCSNILGSSIGMDKVAFNQYLRSIDILTPNYVCVTKQEYDTNKDEVLNNAIAKVGFPLIIKPSRLGSSIGINVCKSIENFDIMLSNSLLFDNNVIVEEYLVPIKEYNLAIYKTNKKLVFSNFEQPITSSDILSFENKYMNSSKSLSSVKKVKPRLSVTSKNYMTSIAKLVYIGLDLKGVVRFDFIICKGKVYLNEINTIPGSFAYYLFDDKISFSTQLTDQINYAIKYNLNENNLINTFDSSVLKLDVRGKLKK